MPVAEDCTRHEAWTSFKEFDRFRGTFHPKELTNIGIDRAYLHLQNHFGDVVVDSGVSMHIMSKEGIHIRRETLISTPYDCDYGEWDDRN